MVKKYKSLSIIITGLFLLSSCGTAASSNNVEDILPVNFYQDIFTFEYGSIVDLTQMNVIYGYRGEVELPAIDTMIIGETTYTVVADEQEYGMNVNVVDTVFPVINGLSDKTITIGDSFNPLDGITATDPIDGILAVVSEETVDTSTAGSYSIKVSSSDKNGNKTENTYMVTVQESKSQTTVGNSTQPSSGTSNSSGSSNSSESSNSTSGSSDSGSSDSSTNINKPQAGYYYLGDKKFHSYCEVYDTGQFWCHASSISPLASDNYKIIYSEDAVNTCKATSGCEVFYESNGDIEVQLKDLYFIGG